VTTAGRDPGLAPERTLLAWTRTGLGLTATGALVLKLAAGPGPLAATYGVGGLLVALGAVAFVEGYRAHPMEAGTGPRLPLGPSGAPGADRARLLRLLSLGLTVVAVLAVALSLAQPGG
jgi:hypothetical protein